MSSDILLTQYSHGAGCGCKIAPKVLDEILKSSITVPDNDKLLVGNHSRDDAAVYDLGNGMALISTTDFFMPIVDDAFDFGRIAAANSISDVYAMGGQPLMAIAILGWPVEKLPVELAQKVIEGGRTICAEAGIPLAGGHSIDSPEPIFGLAVNGIIPTNAVKQNNTAVVGNELFLTKALGVGILTTAEKKGILKPEHAALAAAQMMQLNKVGEALGKISGVKAMTDVTGFGLLGHLIEMAEGSGTSAKVLVNKLPLITPELLAYIDQKAVPGGTQRNWASYGHKINMDGFGETEKSILADPQSSGGLLIAVDPSSREEVLETLKAYGLGDFTEPIGEIIPKEEAVIRLFR